MKNRKILIAVILIILASVCLSVPILRHSDKQTVEIVKVLFRGADILILDKDIKLHAVFCMGQKVNLED